jgi:hypothetical protein
MNIFPNKSLIREIAPGVIQIGNNPFAPSLSLNELTKKAQVSGNDVLTDGALDNISGVSLDYDLAIIDNATFLNRPQADGKNVLLEGDFDEAIERTKEKARLVTKEIRENHDSFVESTNLKITQESTARSTKDQELSDSITQESTARSTKDQELLDSITQESTNRLNADTALSTEISSEIFDRQQQDELIKNSITTSSGTLSTHIDDLEVLFNNSLLDASGILSQSIDDSETLFNNSLNLISGLLSEEIQQLKTETTSDLSLINNNINNLNTDISNTREDVNEINTFNTNISGDLSSLSTDVENLESEISSINNSISGISYVEAEALAKKWAIVLG